MECYDYETDSALSGEELDRIIEFGEIKPCFIEELPNYPASKIVYNGRTYRLIAGIAEILEQRKMIKFHKEVMF